MLKFVNIFKYLKVIFTRGGSFSKTIKHNSDQANKAMFLLLRKINPLYLSIDLQIELFDKMIVVVVLLFYVHGKHLRSCRNGQLT